ncbi:MAG: hypothetical protein BYD32DRAFT_169736 [Podila humilis]|nr:MAG: hypothetical protein BYD32DRAFT_169736 [Podila humilis]
MAKPPKVMITGAGIGGLTLAILLERQGVDYEVFEQRAAVRSLGSATGLMPNVLALLEQIGLLAELEDISRVGLRLEVFQESLEKINSLEFEPYESICGYNTLVVPRPDLHQLLLSHVPAAKIHVGQKSSQSSRTTTASPSMDGRMHTSATGRSCPKQRSTLLSQEQGWWPLRRRGSKPRPWSLKP